MEGLTIRGELQRGFVELLDTLAQIVGPTAELLLELTPGRIDIGERSFPFAHGTPVGF